MEEKRNQKREKEDKEQEGTDRINIASLLLKVGKKKPVILSFLFNNSTDSLSSLDFKDSKSDIEEEITLCNTVLITGPPGVGKTAAVYACAQELGFKVCGVLSRVHSSYL